MTEINSHRNAVPEQGTAALLEYLWSSRREVGLFFFVVHGAINQDYASHIARRALDGLDREAENPAELAKKRPGRSTKQLRSHKQQLLESTLTRAVDGFQVYLVEAIRLALYKQPRILADRKQEMTLGHILKFASIEDLTRDIIETKVQSLGYEGFGEVERWCKDRSLPLIVPAGCERQVIELIALRNIIVHNRCRVDSRFLSAVPTSTFKVGEERKLDVDELFEAIRLLDQVACMTDTAMVGKFGLSTVDVRAELELRSNEYRAQDETSDNQSPMDSSTPPT